MNPQDVCEDELIESALEGNREALEELLRRHQDWVYNLVLRMLWSPQDAEDVTQEVLLKALTKLSTFRRQSSFRTWLYRIAANHILDLKKRPAEERTISFEEYAARINRCPDSPLPVAECFPVAPEVLVEETRLTCTTGMLLCLNREQRLTLILGAILQLDDKTAAQVMKVSPVNFRQKLSRARRALREFMQGQCGLVNPKQPCRCANKTEAFRQRGVINPQNLRFNRSPRPLLSQVVGAASQIMETWLAEFRSHPFASSPDFTSVIRAALLRRDFQEAWRLDPPD